MRASSIKGSRVQAGFNLIEVVVGIVTFAVVLTIVNSVIAPQATKSVDPIHQVRATELAQSMFNEILGKLYDENSDRSGGRIRCGEDLDGSGTVIDTGASADDDGEIVCTTWLGPEDGGPELNGVGGTETRADNDEDSRANFDDIDDYDGLTYSATDIIQNSLGENLVVDGEELYAGFSVSIKVMYDADFDGDDDMLDFGDGIDEGNVKLVQIQVTTPNDIVLHFSSYKFNF